MGARWASFRAASIWRPRAWKLWETFNGFKEQTRKMLVLAFIGGFCLLILCTISDLRHYGWWEDQAYIPNIVASFTSFMIGAPIGLVVLATFTTEREESATLKRVNSLSTHAWLNFRNLVYDFASDERYTALVEDARKVNQMYSEASSAIDQYLNYVNYVCRDTDAEYGLQLGDKVDYIKYVEYHFRNATNAVTQALGYQMDDEWGQLVGAWRVLDQYIRLQRLEQRLNWFNKISDAGLRKLMSRESNPVRDLMNLTDIRRYTPETSAGVGTMRQALDTLNHYSRLDDEALTERIVLDGNLFVSFVSKRYHLVRDEAQIFLIDLKRLVGLVDIEYWPVSQSEPYAFDITQEMNTHQWMGSLRTEQGRKKFEQQFNKAAAQQYREKLRRRSPGNRSGSDLRRNTDSTPISFPFG